MEVSVKCEARHICIRLSGELDHHSAAVIREAVDEMVESALPKALVLDFENCSFYGFQRNWADYGTIPHDGIRRRLSIG